MKAAIYLYNHIFNATILNNINNNTINPNNSILNNTGVGYFNLVNYREYLHLKVYGCRVYIYIPQDLQIQSQKIIKRVKKGILIKYKNSLIYHI